MAITLTSSFQNVATVTSPVMGANYGLRLYLRYVDSTVYYELRYYGYQSMGYKNLSAYLKEGGRTFKDLTADCYGGSTSSNAEWTWQNGSWNVNNANQVYSQTLTFEGWACPSKDGARQTKEFTYAVPSRTVIPHNPVASISFDKTNYELNDKVTISWTEQEGGATPDKYQVILHKNNTWRPEALLKAWVSNDARSHTFNITLAEDGYAIGDALTVEVQSWFGEEAKVLYSGYGYTNDYPRVVANLTNATISYYQGDVWADAVRYELSVNSMNDATTFTGSPHLVATAPDGTVITATGWENVILKGLKPNTTYTLDIAAYTDIGAISERTFFTTPEYIAPEFTYAIWQSDQNLIGRVTMDNRGNAYEVNLGWRELYELPVGWSYPNIYDGYDLKLGEEYIFTGLTNFENGTQYSASIMTDDSLGNYNQVDSNIIIIQSSVSSTLPIHISLNGAEFKKCSNVKISVNGGEFKTLPAAALKIQ